MGWGGGGGGVRPKKQTKQFQVPSSSGSLVLTQTKGVADR